MMPSTLPDCAQIRRAPQRTALILLDAALLVAERALRAEHHNLDLAFAEPQHEVSPVLITGHFLVSRFAELRSLLATYDATLTHALGEDRAFFDFDDLPF